MLGELQPADAQPVLVARHDLARGREEQRADGDVPVGVDVCARQPARLLVLEEHGERARDRPAVGRRDALLDRDREPRAAVRAAHLLDLPVADAEGRRHRVVHDDEPAERAAVVGIEPLLVAAVALLVAAVPAMHRHRAELVARPGERRVVGDDVELGRALARNGDRPLRDRRAVVDPHRRLEAGEVRRVVVALLLRRPEESVRLQAEIERRHRPSFLSRAVRVTLQRL